MLLRTFLLDGDKGSAHVEWLEAVETGRRRRRSEDEKLKIVLESLPSSRQAAATARRYAFPVHRCCGGGSLFRPEPHQIVFGRGVRDHIWSRRSGPRWSDRDRVCRGSDTIIGAVDTATLKAVVAALAEGRPR